MKFSLPPDNRDQPDEELLKDLRAVAAALGAHALTYRVYEERGRFACETVRRRFGSWNRALAKAGLSASKRHRIPNSELIASVAQVWMQLGRPPSRTEFDRLGSGASDSTVENRFGGWRRALEAVVLELGDGTVKDSSPQEEPTTRATTPRTPDLRLRWRIMQRDQFRCVKCGATPALDPRVVLHVDHVVPWKSGGRTEFENLQTLCQRCNLGKGTLPNQ